MKTTTAIHSNVLLNLINAYLEINCGNNSCGCAGVRCWDPWNASQSRYPFGYTGLVVGRGLFTGFLSIPWKIEEVLLAISVHMGTEPVCSEGCVCS